MINGCISSLSQQGAKVRLVTANQKESCDFINVVTSQSSWGASAGHNTQGVMNELRNQVAQLGGNALYIISSNTPGLFSEQASGSGEALKCKFK